VGKVIRTRDAAIEGDDRTAYYCSVQRCRPNASVRSPARIGASKTGCTGSHTVMNEATPETATTIAPIISRFYAYGPEPDAKDSSKVSRAAIQLAGWKDEFSPNSSPRREAGTIRVKISLNFDTFSYP